MITRDTVKGLLAQAGGQAVLSLYLNVDNAVRENQADPPAWRIWLKRTLRECTNDATDQAQDIPERAAAYFEHYRPASKGVIAFFGDDWEQVYAVPVPLANQGRLGDLLMEPLLRILSEYQPYLVVQVSREEAHFYVSLLGQTEFQDSLEIDLEEYDFAQKTLMPATATMGTGDRGGLTQGSNRDSFDDMIEAHRARFYRDVVDYTQQLMQDRQVQRVILGGSEQAAHAVHNHMPETLRKRVIAIESLPGHLGTHEIFTHVQPQALAYEQAQAAAVVDDLLDKARAGGRAVLGPEAVQHALERQQVETLFLSDQLSDKDRANDLVGRALNINSEVEMLFGPAAEKLQVEAGGVAARLYYPM